MDRYEDETPECPVDVWARTALDDPDDPRWSKDAANRVLEALVAKGRVVVATQPRAGRDGDACPEMGGASSDDTCKRQEEPRDTVPVGWVAWAHDHASGTNESAVFCHVRTIFQDTCGAAATLDPAIYGQATTVYEPSPDASTNAEVRFVRPSHGDPSASEHKQSATSDTAVVAEFSLSGSDAMQTVGGANHLMHNDPRRRFVLALTIEGTLARFWRFDRSLVLVSKQFDCDAEPEHLIRFILHVSFASKTQLGLDPTVTAFPNEERQVDDFVYEIDGRYFRTLGHPLCKRGALPTISRGARVWEGVECDAAGEPLMPERKSVLHDLWLPDDARSEKQIQDDVLEALKLVDENDPLKTTDPLNDKDLLAPTSRVEQMRKLFLTITACEEVTIDGKIDMTIVKPAEACPITFAQSSNRVREHGPQGYQHSIMSDRGIARESKKSQCRVHWRYVVEEVCQTMYDFDNMKAVLGVFKDFTVALDLFRQAGYMHRDISGGNCLVYTDPKTGEHRAKLADLEFCKPFAALICHDPVTGTYEFMAVESHQRKLMFRPPSRIVIKSAAREAVPMYHPHPFHDLEGLHWVMVWYILHWYFDTRPPEARPPTQNYWAWREAVYWYFNSTDSILNRRMLLQNTSKLVGLWQMWDWDMAVLEILTPCLDFGMDLVDIYKALQQKPQVDNKWPLSVFTGDIYEEFGKRLGEAARAFPPGCAVPMNSYGSSSPKHQLEVDSNTPDGGDAKKVALSDGK